MRCSCGQLTYSDDGYQCDCGDPVDTAEIRRRGELTPHQRWCEDNHQEYTERIDGKPVHKCKTFGSCEACKACFDNENT